MKRLQCKQCGHKWTPKKPNPTRCGYYPCRSMLWNGRERTWNQTHALSKTPIYKIWSSMKQRCLNPANPRWSSYGGVGIKIDPRWLVFENFLKDMGQKPEGKTLDRFPDPFGNYTKSNCRWATPLQQQNNMRNNRILEYNGRRQTLAQWARELNINISTLAKRVSRGWSIEEAATRSTVKNKPWRRITE